VRRIASIPSIAIKYDVTKEVLIPKNLINTPEVINAKISEQQAVWLFMKKSPLMYFI